MKYDTKFLTRTALLLAVTLMVQYLKMPQLITGSLVNAMLLIAAGAVGVFSGITIGLLTPFIALLVGILKFPPMVPFIMAGNALYVLLYSLQKNPIIGVVLAAVAKYAWLSISVLYILKWFGIQPPPPIVQAFTLPQLFTALLGGAIGVAVIFLLQRSFVKEKEV
ncbi:MAG: ECF transporter S component [Thermosediminibacteraceae bacterium]|nr:ECF transporter S component [Thermosediminibacteraceae bacterium]